MAIALSDLVKDLTREEVLEDLLAVAKALGLSTTAWQPGEPVWVLLTTLADQLSKLWNGVIVRALRAGFIDYAEGGWLTLLAWTMYGVYRKDATFGATLITLENRGGGFYPIAPGDIRIANADGATFVNTTSGTLGSWNGTGTFPTVDLQFVADEAGSASSTPIGGIQAYPTEPQTTFPGVFARTNVAAIVGADVEDDDGVRARCRLSTGPLSPAGAKSAYESVALSTKRPDGSYIDCTRTRVRTNGGGKTVVYLASATGPTPGSDVLEGSDVYLANIAIQDTVQPWGITALVEPAIGQALTVDATVYVSRSSNVTAVEAIASVKAALALYFAKLPIGGYTITPGVGSGYVFREALVAVAGKANAGIYRADVLLDGAALDVALALGGVALPTINVTATVVTQ